MLANRVLTHSLGLRCRQLVLVAVLLATASVVQAQKQASCSYTFFPTQFFTPPLSHFGQLSPSGINDFRTVVGVGFQTGFIRWANGGYTFPKGTSSLSDRNDEGVSIGHDKQRNPIILRGANITSAAVTIGTNTLTGPGLAVLRINDWGSIVGWYGDDAGIAHGFKRWANRKGFTLDFPAHFKDINSGTFPTAINDKGVIVGFTQVPYHAFVYYKGVWTTLRYPKAIGTWLYGISNAGVLIGSAQLANGSTTGFLYKNGKFEVITPPNTVGPGVGSNVPQ